MADPSKNDGNIKPKLDLSVVLITLNEEQSLPKCLASLPKGCEIVAIDSGSSDKTVKILEDFKARVTTRAFDDYSSQKNAAIDLATRNWVLSIDADEEISPSLRDSITKIVKESKSTVSGYHLDRRLHFMGRKMRFGKTSDAPLRVFKRKDGRFFGPIHERIQIESGEVGSLSGELLHYSYDDLTDYFDRFNSYTSRIAADHHAKGKKLSMVKHLARPWVEFLSRYILRGGFLDGYPGYVYALVSSNYAFVKYAKLKELQERTGFQ